MLRSKATAALMKLKEIDRKYKIKYSEDVKLHSSDISDISTIDSRDEISKRIAMSAGSGVKPDAITSTRPKLDIRMPDARMERSAGMENESSAKLVTIFDKSDKKKFSKSHHDDVSRKIITPDETINVEPNVALVHAAGVEENVLETLQTIFLQNDSLIMSEEQMINAERSISEDVPEVISSSHPVSDHLEASVSREITLKSVDSIIDDEENVKSGLDEDLSTLVVSGTYSDDFDKSLSETLSRAQDLGSLENVEESRTEVEKNVLVATEQVVNNNAKPDTEEIMELVAPKVLRVISECDANLDVGLSNYVKEMDHYVDKEVADPVCLLQRSSKCSSARSGKDQRRRKRKPHTSSSRRDYPTSKSPEFSSSLGQKTESEVTGGSESLNPSKSELHIDKNSQIAVIFKQKHKEELKKPQLVSFLESQKLVEDQRNADQILRNMKEEVMPIIGRELKVKSENPKTRIRARDSSTKEPPTNYSLNYQTHKFSYPDEVGRPAHRTSKYQAISRNEKRRLKKPNIRDIHGSEHRTKGGSFAQCKNRTKAHDPGLRCEATDVDILRQQIQELRLQQERDEIRARVRWYLQRMMNEKQRLLDHGNGFGSSLSVDQYLTGLRQNESLRSFFKPLDLPNVADFKRPDFEDDQTADLDNERYLHLRMIHERLLGIRHWLKQQFVLYRDYSNLVSTINAKYIPVTLKETKKMIRDMQRFYNNRERRHHVR